MRPLLRMVTLLRRSPLYASAAIVLGIASLALAACASSSNSNTLSRAIRTVDAAGNGYADADPVQVHNGGRPELQPQSGNRDQPAQEGRWRLGRRVGKLDLGELYRAVAIQQASRLGRPRMHKGRSPRASRATRSLRATYWTLRTPRHVRLRQIKSAWNLLHDPYEGKGKHAVTEILGINDSELAVGFYKTPNPAGGQRFRSW